MPVENSYEEYRMQNAAERYSWACFQLLISLSSIVGDSLILVASSKKDSFKLNSFLVTIMRHIAACDITLSVTHVLPSAVSLIGDSWVLGETLCSMKPYLGYYFYPANMYLICVLTTGKFLLLTKPLFARNLTIKKAHVACGIVWATFLANPLLMYMSGKDDVSFDYRTYACEYGWNSPMWKKAQPVMFVLSCFFPNALIITTTAPTLKYLVAARTSAKRTRGSVPWQGALTVFLTALVYCLSTLPGTVWLVGNPFVADEDPSAEHFHLLYRYGIYMAMINITSNFFIYTLTITSFRRYLLSKIATMTVSVSLSTSRRAGQDEETGGEAEVQARRDKEPIGEENL